MIRTAHRSPTRFFAGSGYAPNDVGNFVQARDLPWNVIGQNIGHIADDKKAEHQGMMTAKEALVAANLDIHVEKWATRDQDGNEIPKLFVTGYDDPDAGRIYFAGVSDKYNVAQPAEALSFFDNIIFNLNGAHYSAVWNMREKSMMGVTIEFPDEIVIDPKGAADVIGLYGLGINSFDGSTGLGYYVSPVRMFCLNQLSTTLKSAHRSISFKHTKGVTSRVQEARQALGVTMKYAEEFDKAATALFEQAMTDKQFERLVKSIDGPNGFKCDGTESDLTKSRRLQRVDNVLTAWKADHNANITGTKWGAFNVLAEYAEWGRTVHGSPRTQTTAVRQRAIGTLVNWPTAFRYQVLQKLGVN